MIMLCSNMYFNKQSGPMFKNAPFGYRENVNIQDFLNFKKTVKQTNKKSNEGDLGGSVG